MESAYFEMKQNYLHQLHHLLENIISKMYIYTNNLIHFNNSQSNSQIILYSSL